jgi:hypothetical protein
VRLLLLLLLLLLTMLVPDKKAQGPQLTHCMPYVPHALRDQVDRIRRPEGNIDTEQKRSAPGGQGLSLISICCVRHLVAQNAFCCWQHTTAAALFVLEILLLLNMIT